MDWKKHIAMKICKCVANNKFRLCFTYVYHCCIEIYFFTCSELRLLYRWIGYTLQPRQEVISRYFISLRKNIKSSITSTKCRTVFNINDPILLKYEENRDVYDTIFFNVEYTKNMSSCLELLRKIRIFLEATLDIQ